MVIRVTILIISINIVFAVAFTIKGIIIIIVIITPPSAHAAAATVGATGSYLMIKFRIFLITSFPRVIDSIIVSLIFNSLE
jgi:hypothetical protein